MKKYFFVFVSMVMAMAMTACLGDPEYHHTGTFARLVTIDRTQAQPKFVCDYTGEVYTCSNVKSNEDLASYGLKEAERAFVYFDFESTYEASTVSLNSGTVITPASVSGVALPKDVEYCPVYGFERLELEPGWSYPYAWVSGHYLSIMPVTMSDDAPSQYLLPKYVSNDTLYFSLYMSYEKSTSYRSEYICYDLRSLMDTIHADETCKPVLSSMLKALDEGRKQVSLCVMADYVSADTIIKAYAPTDKCYIRLGE